MQQRESPEKIKRMRIFKFVNIERWIVTENDLLLRLERYNLGFCCSVLVVSTKGIIVNRRSISGVKLLAVFTSIALVVLTLQETIKTVGLSSASWNALVKNCALQKKKNKIGAFTLSPNETAFSNRSQISKHFSSSDAREPYNRDHLQIT